MTPRGVAVQGGMAFVALVLAYTTWQRSPELQTGEVFVIDSTKNDLEKIRFEDSEAKTWTEVARAKDAEGSFISVRLSGYDNTGVGLPSGHPGVALKQAERLVRGSEAATRLFERFAPLRAERALGVLDPAMLKDLGLDTSKRTIEVTTRGVKRKFNIVPAPPGGSDPYLQDQQDKKVYIVSRPILSDLQSASTNLVERKVHNFRIEDIDHVSVDAGGKKKELVGSRIEDYPGIRLAPAETPDKTDPTLKNWNDKVFALFPAEVLGQGEVPSIGAPLVAVRLDYSSRGRRLGFVELARGATAATSSPTPPKIDVYARTEYSLGWVRLPPETLNLITEAEALVAKK